MKLKLLVLSLLYLTSCNVHVAQNDSPKVETEIKIVEIGAKELPYMTFPDTWYTQTYEGGPVLTSKDSTDQLNFEKIDYFDGLKGSKLSIGKYKRLLVNKGESLDSLFLCESYSINGNKFEYLAAYKSKRNKEHLYPITINEVYVVRLEKNDLKEKLLVYSKVVSDYSIATKIGHLDSLGRLTMKEFNVEEVNVEYKGQSITDYHTFFE